ncbi:DUF3013 family protein [Facklamia sp. DSM 111018]|uniref:DUF3013 family protein n=1 Tax=Facklamia lactis TaxID=2749967 RepID=A0ABS0LP70_9LACT|nr:DUF3013 family protein [Facklamia lactis]MBG9980146.1 DUF3013 family protein [Facklamia lactis]MBG9985948.1 DUF3013 family protein [Facklamia lactis]
MKVENLYKICIKLMEEHHFQCEWQVTYEEEKEELVISLQFNLPNSNNQKLVDYEGVKTDHSQVIYQANVLITNYPITYAEDQYFLCYVFDQQKGIYYGDLEALVKQLKLIASSCLMEWEKFLNDDQRLTFALTWDWQAYYKQVDKLKEHGRFSRLPLNFISPVRNSLMQEGIIK